MPVAANRSPEADEAPPRFAQIAHNVNLAAAADTDSLRGLLRVHCMSVRYAHLHLHSEYSLVDSTIRIKALVDACVRAGMPAVALTDECNMFALVKFYKACSAAGIKPIGGCDLWIAAPDDPRPWRLTLLCQNHAGYLNLSRLVSRAWREGQHGGQALVDAGWLTPTPPTA